MTASGSPTVLSVIVPCLNAASTLEVQLSALAGQSCPVGWELLLCDNGSTDASLAIAQRYQALLPQLRIVDARDQRGAGPARNRGVEVARGRWLAFCDADDEVAADWLAAMCAALARHPFVAGRFEAQRLNSRRTLRSRQVEQQGGLQTSDLGDGLAHAGGGNMGIHREIYRAVGGFDPSVEWLEDTDFSWRVQRLGIPLVFCPEVVIHMRLRSSFRSMWRQGLRYGRAAALLEQRYGRSPDRPSEAGRSGGTRGPSGRARRVAAWTVDHLIAGRLIWRAAWVVGHRTARSAGTAGAAVRS